MSTSITHKIFILLTCSCLSFFNSRAQVATNAKLVGCWKVVKVEFHEADEDSADIIDNFKGASTCFEANGKFASKQMVKGKETNVGTGTYTIAKDGKTMHQRSKELDDNYEDADIEILALTNELLKIKVETIILNFEKVKE